jgi:short-subunit dehydrogenase
MGWLSVLLGVLAIFFLPYVLHHLIVAYLCSPRDLKKAYNAQWALVTGSSSGIGKAIAARLAQQGLNVVLAAYPDKLLDACQQELQSKYSRVQIRKVPVDLSKPGFLDSLDAATKDITVQVVFCNAGYMVTGFFEDRTLQEHLANIHVNATSAVVITHHYLKKMTSKSLRGCFVYTSSAAAAIPSPFSTLYAATKSFLSSFGAGLAAETRHLGIDVLVFHPSPVNTRFYDKAHSLDILNFFKKQAVSADSVVDPVLASIGRTVWRDIGPTAVGFRLLMRVFDYNFFAYMTAIFSFAMPDFKRESAKKHT